MIIIYLSKIKSLKEPYTLICERKKVKTDRKSMESLLLCLALNREGGPKLSPSAAGASLSKSIVLITFLRRGARCGERSAIGYLPAHRGPVTMGTRVLAVHSKQPGNGFWSNLLCFPGRKTFTTNLCRNESVCLEWLTTVFCVCFVTIIKQQTTNSPLSLKCFEYK